MVNRGLISWDRLITVLSKKPAEIFKLKGGSIREGNFADLVVVDIKDEYRIDSSKFFSKAKYSPFDGQKVKGRPILTFVRGQLVYDSGEILGKPGSGEMLRPEPN
jgi:dihydroorotase